MRKERAIEVTAERVERFWRKVPKRSADQCWEWSGERHTHGYGLHVEWSGNRRSMRVLAHRLSLVIHGEDVSGKVVRHDCDNPPCVNPNHLRTGTQGDNVRDSIDRGRLNTSGLAIGQGAIYPPRPCWRCGVTVSEGRKRYCPECRKIVKRESQERYRNGLTRTERRKLRGAA